MIYESPKIVTGWLSHGDIIQRHDTHYLILSSTPNYAALSFTHKAQPIAWGLGSITISTNPIDLIINSKEPIEVKGKMFLWTDGNYHHHTMDDCQAPSPPQTHAAILPTDHPLREVAYWNAPGGKNLTIIHCLEWALKHLTIENEKLPCQENIQARWRLMEALQAQQTRQKLRQEQGVLGTMNAHKSHDLSL